MTTDHRARYKQAEPIYLKGRIKMLESMLYRLYTNQELSDGQMSELVRIIQKENPDYFKEVKDGKVE